MASFGARCCFGLLVAFFCFTLSVEAREGKLFFSKFTHLGANKEVGPTPKPAPVSPAPAPAPAQVVGGVGEGHFGPGSGMIPQTKESWPVSSTTSDEEFDKLMETFDSEKGYNNDDDDDDDRDKLEAENYDTGKLTEDFEEEEEEDSENSQDPSEQKGNYNDDDDDNGYTYKSNNHDDHDGNVRGYGEERQGMSDTRFMENGKYFYNAKGQNYENTPTTRYYNENARGRHGTSDTRFMENGNNFDDVNTPTQYETGGGARENYHPNEFNSMEEYYKSLEGSEESMP